MYVYKLIRMSFKEQENIDIRIFVETKGCVRFSGFVIFKMGGMSLTVVLLDQGENLCR